MKSTAMISISVTTDALDVVDRMIALYRELQGLGFQVSLSTVPVELEP